MSKTHQKTVVAVMEALKSHGCITGYTVEGNDGRPEWTNNGFAKAFEEFKTNSTPLGLKKQAECGWLLAVLTQKNPSLKEWTVSILKERHGL